MPSPNFYKSNLAAAEISSAIGISDTTITITPAEAAIFPTAPFHATIMPPSGTPNMLNSEIVEVSAVNTTTGALTVVRAQRGTTAKAFSVNAVIMVGVYSEDAVFLSTDGTPESTSPWIQSSDIQTDAVTWEKAAFQKYSTSETVIGRWIDGKPIYRKVVQITNPQTSNTNYLVVSNVMDNLIKLYGYMKGNNGARVPVPQTDSSSTYSVLFVNTDGTLRGRFSYISEAPASVYVVVEYTKTTD